MQYDLDNYTFKYSQCQFYHPKNHQTSFLRISAKKSFGPFVILVLCVFCCFYLITPVTGKKILHPKIPPEMVGGWVIALERRWKLFSKPLRSASRKWSTYSPLKTSHSLRALLRETIWVFPKIGVLPPISSILSSGFPL